MQITIVALPEDQDLTNEVSSEKAAHMTLLFLGDVPFEQAKHVVEQVEHISKNLHRFYMDVDYRGELGPDEADVLFFKTNEHISEARDFMLKDEIIRKAFDSNFQYPQWSPHLTLGYPDKPAKKIDAAYSRFYSVCFDRISVWTSDSDGPTFRLEAPNYAYDEVSMSEENDVNLQHHGIKGMKWGVRRNPGSDGLVGESSSSKPDSEKTSSGAKTTGFLARRKDKSENKTESFKKTPHNKEELSAEELRRRIDKMQLENQYAKLLADRNAAKESLGKRMVRNLLNTASDNLVRRVGSEIGDNTAEVLLKSMGVTTKQARSDTKEERKNRNEELDREERRLEREAKTSKKGDTSSAPTSSGSKKSKSEHAKKPKNSQSFSTNDFDAWVKNNPTGADRDSATKGLPERIYKITNL